jgi:hypothetical protein
MVQDLSLYTGNYSYAQNYLCFKEPEATITVFRKQHWKQFRPVSTFESYLPYTFLNYLSNYVWVPQVVSSLEAQRSKFFLFVLHPPPLKLFDSVSLYSK